MKRMHVFVVSSYVLLCLCPVVVVTSCCVCYVLSVMSCCICYFLLCLLCPVVVVMSWRVYCVPLCLLCPVVSAVSMSCLEVKIGHLSLQIYDHVNFFCYCLVFILFPNIIIEGPVAK